MSLPLDVTERLLDRIRLAAAFEGVSLESFAERALIASVLDTERRIAKDAELYRDAKTHPYQCDYCEKRFKLPMHRARHVQWSHPEMVDERDQIAHEPPLGLIVEEEDEAPTKAQFDEQKREFDATGPPVPDEKFKLAPGIDADMFDDFEKRFTDDVPRLD